MIDELVQSPLKQIAREAAEKIHQNQGLGPCGVERMTPIILTAIEKAHQSGWHEGRQYQVEYGTPEQRQRSEPEMIYNEIHAVIKRCCSEYDELTVFQIVGALEAAKHDVLDNLKQHNEKNNLPDL